MTVSGQYSTRNHTVADIQSFKGKRQLTKILPFRKHLTLLDQKWEFMDFRPWHLL